MKEKEFESKINLLLDNSKNLKNTLPEFKSKFEAIIRLIEDIKYRNS
jgi:hypothetical protein